MSSVATVRLGFMPLLRTGDFLFNAFVLRHRMIGGGTVVDMVKEMRGTDGMYQDVFGGDAATATRRVLGYDGISKGYSRTTYGARCLSWRLVSRR